MAVSGEQRSYDAALQEVDDVETEKYDVWCLSEVLSGEKVSEDKEHNVGDENDNHPCYSHRYRQSSTTLSMPPIRDRLKQLTDKLHTGKDESKRYQSNVDPEPYVVVSCVGDGAPIEVGIVREQQVGNS